MKKIALFTLIGLFLLALPVWAGTNLLHEFAGGTADGAEPYGSLILSDSTLYGMTRYGGDFDLGTIFKIKIDGSGYARLHEFAGGTADGEGPNGSLIISGSNLYGMTRFGGDNNKGTIFKIQTNGSGFTLLHEFAGGVADGQQPNGSLILSSSTLYGMTLYGGNSDYGTIFKIQTDGSGFTLLHEFAGGAADGAEPRGDLIISGSTLYGMTYYGGDYDVGTIFNIQTGSTGFTLLHAFAGGANDGAYPYGSLIISGSTIYGITKNGGDDDYGTVFKMETDSSGYTLLHEFAGGTADGVWPYGSLIISGSALFGMTEFGGNNYGTIFKIQTNGSGFALLHKFAGGAADGAIPFGSLIISGSALFGMTYGGGDSDKGVIFTMPISCVDFIGTWDGQGVYYRNSETGAFVKLATPATLITAGDLDGDGKADLIGIWPSQGGVWVKYSQSGSWAKLSTSAIDIACNDMNGDGRDDLVATWDVQGVYYRNSIGGAWVMMATPATLVTAGDLDGDNKADVIGIWPGQVGVWVKYSQSGTWAKLSTTTARHIAAGHMRGGAGSSPALLLEPFGGVTAGQGNLGYQDMAAAGPGDRQFQCQEEKNLTPQDQDIESALNRVPGPGEYGFQCLEQKNLVPDSKTKK
jgi:uncharacterized repeat protein (TIGR03803 family)